jgi:hypothetical protein
MEIEPYDNWSWIINKSTPDKTHIVRLEVQTGEWSCDCGDYVFERRTNGIEGVYYPDKKSKHCKHINRARNYLLDEVVRKLKP